MASYKNQMFEKCPTMLNLELPPRPLSPQYQAWWKERYGKSSFSDEEEVEALLTQKSLRNSTT